MDQFSIILNKNLIINWLIHFFLIFPMRPLSKLWQNEYAHKNRQYFLFFKLSILQNIDLNCIP